MSVIPVAESFLTTLANITVAVMIPIVGWVVGSLYQRPTREEVYRAEDKLLVRMDKLEATLIAHITRMNASSN